MKHRLAPHPPAAGLRPHLPLWAYGLEGDWLLRHQAAGLAALAMGAPKFSLLSARLAAWAFERAPLDPALAAAAREAGRHLDDAPARRALTRELARRLVRPANAPALAPLAQAPDPAPALAFLTAAMDDARHGLYWRGKAFALALARGLPELARQAVAPLLADPALSPLGGRLALEAALAWDGPAAGQEALTRLDRACFPRYAALAQAHLLAETGRREAAAAVLATLWREENWHPDLTARLAALLAPPPAADLSTLPGALHVFVYTWNRAALLGPTLERLAASRLGPARVTVLDNGGTDDTAAVCRAMAERFAPGRFAGLSLPVNIGAPAARNWLARTAGLRPNDLAAYLDDDALVAPDWLEQLAGALAADAEADVAGARVVADAPGAARVAQSADVRLLPPDQAHAGPRPLGGRSPLRLGFRLLPSAARPRPHRAGRALRHPLLAQPVRRSGPGSDRLYRRPPGRLRRDDRRGPSPARRAGPGQDRRRRGPAPGRARQARRFFPPGSHGESRRARPGHGLGVPGRGLRHGAQAAG
jgi:hypothetical protein